VETELESKEDTTSYVRTECKLCPLVSPYTDEPTPRYPTLRAVTEAKETTIPNTGVIAAPADTDLKEEKIPDAEVISTPTVELEEKEVPTPVVSPVVSEFPDNAVNRNDAVPCNKLQRYLDGCHRMKLPMLKMQWAWQARNAALASVKRQFRDLFAVASDVRHAAVAGYSLGEAVIQYAALSLVNRSRLTRLRGKSKTIFTHPSLVLALFMVFIAIFLRGGSIVLQLGLLAGIFSFFSPSGLSATMVDWAMERQLTANRDSIESRFRELKLRLGFDEKLEFHGKDEWKRAAIVCAKLSGAVALLAGAKYYFDRRRDQRSVIQEARTDFRNPSDDDAKINDMEEQLNCSVPTIRYRSKLNPNWENVHTSIAQVYHTSDAQGLLNKVQANTRAIRVTWGDRVNRAYGLGIGKNILLINTHTLGKGHITKDIVLEIANNADPKSPHWKKNRIGECNRLDLGNDLTLVYLANCVSFSDIGKHLIDLTHSFKCADGMINGVSSSFTYINGALPMNNPVFGIITIDKYLKYTNPDHNVGQCGLPAVIQLGKGWVIAGIHVAGKADKVEAYVNLTYRGIILDGVQRLLTKQNMHTQRGYQSHPAANVITESDDVAKTGLDRFVHPVELTAKPGAKSAMWYEKLDHLDYIGTVKGPIVMNKKSSLIKSKFSLSGALDKMFDDIKWDVQCDYGKPMMVPEFVQGQYISPYNESIKELNYDKGAPDPDIMRATVDYVCEHMIPQLQTLYPDGWAPITMQQAINGAREDHFCRRINPTTGSGFGYTGIKDTHIPVVDDDENFLTREATAELRTNVLKILERCELGDQFHPVYKTQLKDEPRTHAKIAKGQTRMFYMEAIDMLIATRMMLFPLYSAMVEHGEVFSTAVGVDMHRGASALYEEMTSFSRIHLAEDLKAYDKSIPPLVRQAWNTVIMRVLEAMGYNRKALRIVDGMLSALSMPVFMILQDMYMVIGSQPSGKYATAEDNSGVNLIMSVYAWKKAFFMAKVPEPDFYDHVRLKSYGDDIWIAIKEAIKAYYNSVIRARIFKDDFHMIATDPSKSAEIRPTMSPEEVDFLKRTFRDHPVLKKKVATLAKSSIRKTLEWFLPSTSVSYCDQFISASSSALRELFFWETEENYETARKALIEHCAQDLMLPRGYVEKTLPSYSQLLGEYGDEDTGYTAPTGYVETFSPEDVVITESDDRKIATFSWWWILVLLCSTLYAVVEGRRLEDCDMTKLYQFQVKPPINASIMVFFQPQKERNKESFVFDRAGEDNQWSAMNTNLISQQLAEWQDELKAANYELCKTPNPAPGLTPKDLRRSKAYTADPIYRKGCEDYIAVLDRVNALTQSITRLERSVALRKHNNMVFTEADEGDMKSGWVDEKVTDHYENVEDVGGDITIDTSTGYSFVSDQQGPTVLDMARFVAHPVELFSSDIDLETDFDYSFNPWALFMSDPSVRAKLRNYGFTKGSLCLQIAVSGSQFHYGQLQFSYIPHAKTNAVVLAYEAGGNRDAFLRYRSQLLGAHVSDVNNNIPVKFTIPYISPQPIARLFNDSSTAIAHTTPFDSFDNIGKFYISTLNKVRCTAPSPSKVNIFVYAWLEDAEFAAPTGTLMEVYTEADEREKGPVEKTASRLAGVSNVLMMIPEIAPYALASKIFFKGMAGVASIFGFSNPVMNNQPNRVKNEPFQNAANTVGYSLGQRLTLDPKQEITVDPRVVGISEDEMSIASIASRESLLDTFWWSPESAPMNSPIWRAAVHPAAARAHNVASGQKGVQPTTMGWLASVFGMWHGTIKYRFSIVCSKWHRGKIAIFFEPNIAQSILIDGHLDLNKQHMLIVDIQETQNVEVCVNWAFPKSWARNMSRADIITSVGGQFTPGTKINCANGYIAVVPITRLQSPDDSQIEINVYTSSDDLRFNRVTQQFLPSDRTIVTEADEQDAPATCFELNPSNMTDQHISIQHYGEEPRSLRPLLKRYFPTFWDTPPTAYHIDGYYEANLPIFPSFTPTIGGGTEPNPTLWSHMRYAYAAMRGSMRKRVRFTGSNLEVGGHVFVSLDVDRDASGTFIPGFYTGRTASVLDGTLQFVPTTNGGIEVDLPFYSNNLYAFSPVGDPYGGDPNMDPITSRRYKVQWQAPRGDVGATFAEESACGEDFSFLRFIAAPPYSFTI
jgi:hypothetical protein